MAEPCAIQKKLERAQCGGLKTTVQSLIERGSHALDRLGFDDRRFEAFAKITFHGHIFLPRLEIRSAFVPADALALLPPRSESARSPKSPPAAHRECLQKER